MWGTVEWQFKITVAVQNKNSDFFGQLQRQINIETLCEVQ